MAIDRYILCKCLFQKRILFSDSMCQLQVYKIRKSSANNYTRSSLPLARSKPIGNHSESGRGSRSFPFNALFVAQRSLLFVEEEEIHHVESVPFHGTQVKRGWHGEILPLVEGWSERKRGEESSAHQARPCLAPVVLLRSYIRTAAPEFDLIFPRKEIKRKWPPGSAMQRAYSPGNHLKYSKLLP